MSVRSWIGEMKLTSLPVFIVVCLFAVASWIDINGIFVELPLLVNELPEGWNLPSYLVIIIQVANIGPITYTILRKLFPTKVTEWPVIILIISIGFIACVLLSIFWHETTVVGGGGEDGSEVKEASTALFALSSFLALVDCTSSVVFLPYMATFRPQYLTALYIGEGFSGLFPALIGMIQGVGGDEICVNETRIDLNGTYSYQIVAHYPDPRFSVGVFFGIISGLLAVSLLAFLVLHFHPRFARERYFVRTDSTERELQSKDMVQNKNNLKKMDKHEIHDGLANGNFVIESKDNIESYGVNLGKSDEQVSYTERDNEESSFARQASSAGAKSLQSVRSGSTANNKALFEINKVSPTDELDSLPMVQASKSTVAHCDLVLILIAIAWINALTNGFLPSIQSYSCLPYGNLAYTLSVRLSVLANPIACFFAVFVKTSSKVILAVLTVAGTVCSVYHIVLASLSPYPPLYDDDAGAALAVTTFVLLTAIFSYTKLCCASVLADKAGAQGLLWCGGVTQIGSFVGAIISFILVNILKLFASKYPCT